MSLKIFFVRFFKLVERPELRHPEHGYVRMH
jgi:hypothetical protein